MLDHINIRVADYDRSKKFYEAALALADVTMAPPESVQIIIQTITVPSF